MPPITWRNVDAPDLRGASQILGQAQNSLNAALDAFGRPIQMLEATEAKNWQAQKEVNTDQFLQRLQQFKTPEDLAAAQQSGALQQLRDGFGAQIDMKAARDAEQALPGQLQQRFVANQNYLDTKADISERDATAAARERFAVGDVKGGNAIIEAANVRAGTKANTMLEGRKIGREDQSFDLQNKQINHSMNIADRTLAFHIQDAAARRALEAQRIATESANRDKLLQVNSAAQLQAAKEDILKKGILGEGTLDTKEGKQNLMDQLSKSLGLPPNAVRDVQENIFKRFPDGKFKVETKDAKGNKVVESYPVPISQILKAVGDNPEWIGDGALWSRRGDAAGNALESMIQKAAFIPDLRQALMLRDSSAAQVIDSAQQRADAQGVPLFIPPAPVTTKSVRGGTYPKR
jgi:hypothetical protein